MALVPKIDIVINNKCDKIDIYEQTSPYVLATNPTGWVNSGSVATNIDTSEITAADLKIYDSTGVTLLDTIVLKDGSTDVYVGVAGAPIPGSFFAIKDHSWTQSDGSYKLIYTVTDGITTFVNLIQYKLFTCNLENCMNSLKAKIVTTCIPADLEKHNSNYNNLAVLLYGIESAFSAKDFTEVDKLLIDANMICDNLCDCGCGDC